VRVVKRRQQVIEVLWAALLPLAYVNAAWLGGSDAFGGADALSDVDLQVDVDDGYVAATFGAVEAALAAASPIVARLVMPMPTWHGHAQRFYRLRDTAETTAVDVVVFERSDPAVTTTSPSGTATRRSCPTGPGSSAPPRSTPASWPGPWPGRSPASASGCRSPCPRWARTSAAATPSPPWTATTATVLAPLVTLYRARHAPACHDFGARCAGDDLPAEVRDSLVELSFVAGLDDLAAKLPWAERLLRDLLEELGWNGNGWVPLCTVTHFSLVNSSTTAWPPKRPKPLSLIPPKGICGSSPTGWSLTWTMPAWSRSARARPRSGSSVRIPAASP
jgi:hypothetical protein